MKIHGKGFVNTKDAYEYYMLHINNNVKGCKTCYPEEIQFKDNIVEIPQVKKKIRINASKRKQLPKELRVKVYKRSKYKCEICNDDGKAIHHLKGVYKFPELQFNYENLIHLCLICHANMHKNMPKIIFINNKFTTRQLKA